MMRKRMPGPAAARILSGIKEERVVMTGRGTFFSSLRVLLITVIACVSSACGPGGPESEGSGSDAGISVSENLTSRARLYRLFDAYFDEYLTLYPTAATWIGDHRFDDRFEIAIAAEHRDRQRALAERYLREATRIDQDTLSAEAQVDLRLFTKYRRGDIEDLAFPSHLLPFDQFNSTPNEFALLGSGEGYQPFRTARDYENFLGRIDDFAVWTETAVDNMRAGVRRGVVLPTIAVERMLPQIADQIVGRPEESIFYGPVRDLPSSLPAAERDRIAGLYRDTIMGKLVPAYARLHDFLSTEYLAEARPTIGMSALPDGDRWYDHLVAYHTTTGLTAEEIHAIGLSEVARIRDQMETVRRQVGFAGDLPAFFEHLKTDPAYFWPTGDAMLADYRSVEALIDARLGEFFSISPRAGFEIRPVEAFRAASAAGAEYKSPAVDGSRPGIFYLNTYDLSRMARWGMETLFLHEAIPGHHFQQSLAMENAALPRFRRFGTASPWNLEGGVTAYAEGWALYAEDLGVELGLFEDPYQYFGKLNDEMLRAMRLVVDTGIHRMGWSRQTAIDYMRANSSLPEAEVIAEVERYIVWPGQALAYKVGQLEIRRLRSEAEVALGDRFDLPAWHTLVLSAGDVPLDVLAERQQVWVAGHSEN